MEQKRKLEAIKENIIQELAKRIEREEDGKSDNQSSSDSLSSESEEDSEEEDCVLAEIGISSSMVCEGLITCLMALYACS